MHYQHGTGTSIHLYESARCRQQSPVDESCGSNSKATAFPAAGSSAVSQRGSPARQLDQATSVATSAPRAPHRRGCFQHDFGVVPGMERTCCSQSRPSSSTCGPPAILSISGRGAGQLPVEDHDERADAVQNSGDTAAIDQLSRLRRGATIQPPAGGARAPPRSRAAL